MCQLDIGNQGYLSQQCTWPAQVHVGKTKTHFSRIPHDELFLCSNWNVQSKCWIISLSIETQGPHRWAKWDTGTAVQTSGIQRYASRCPMFSGIFSTMARSARGSHFAIWRKLGSCLIPQQSHNSSLSLAVFTSPARAPAMR
jgi:hypothetical protein